jgi:hypothetical protein
LRCSRWRCRRASRAARCCAVKAATRSPCRASSLWRSCASASRRV